MSGDELQAVAEAGDLDGVGRLLAAGADPNQPDDLGVPAFEAAIRRGDEAMLRLFVDHGARLDAVDDEGRTVLHRVASSTDAPPMLQALLAAGAAPTFADASGWTALHLAAAYGYAASVELLLDAGARPTALTGHGLSPADVAEQNGHHALAARLRQAPPTV